MAVRIKDVAQRAGVSEATVSLALNDSPLVNVKTCERIKALAKEMGYVPNPYARRLVMKRSNMIGLIIPDIENVYYASFVRHVNRAVRLAGYGLTISISENSCSVESRIVKEMVDSRVEALLLVPVNKKNEGIDYMKSLEEAGIPVVFATSRYPHVQAPCVMCDLAGGMRLLVEHLIERGFRRIDLLTGPAGVYALDLREESYLRALADQGLSYRRVNHLPDVTYEAAYEAVGCMDFSGCDALILANDMMALGAVNAALERGMRVPEDIVIAGFDDVIFSRVSPVAITTVQQDIEQMARNAAQLALSLINGEKAPDNGQIIPCKILVRKSTTR